MEHLMDEEKLDQNARRLRNFLFHILGCNKKEAKIVIDIFVENYLHKEPVKDESRMEEVIKWAEFVRNNPREVWKPIVNKTINDQYEIYKKQLKQDKMEKK